jgi:hypothetical protein
MKKVMRIMVDVVVLKMMHIKKINSLFYFIKGTLQTVFSMTQFLTIQTFELPTKECLALPIYFSLGFLTLLCSRQHLNLFFLRRPTTLFPSDAPTSKLILTWGQKVRSAT